MSCNKIDKVKLSNLEEEIDNIFVLDLVLAVGAAVASLAVHSRPAVHGTATCRQLQPWRRTDDQPLLRHRQLQDRRDHRVHRPTS